jgi:hypothetical protein
MPSAIVVLFVLYDRLRTAFSSLGNRDVAPWLLTLLLFPLFAVGGYATSIAGYHANARDGRGLYVVERTNLRGLAVPGGPRGTFLSFSHSFDYPSRPADAPAQPLYQLSDYEYVLVLMDAADLLAGRQPGGIALLDSVNPLPFMLGVEPARGANLWSTWSTQAISQRVPGRCALRPGPEVRDHPAMDRRDDAPLWRLSGGALPLGCGDAVLDPADALQPGPANQRDLGAYVTGRARPPSPHRGLAMGRAPRTDFSRCP